MNSVRFETNEEQVRRTLRFIGDGIADDVFRPLARYAAVRTGASAKSRYMREGKGETGPNTTGTLRIKSAELIRSVTLLRGREGQAGKGFINVSVTKKGRYGFELTQDHGTTVAYARAHEEGLDKTVQVKRHTRRSKADDVIKDVSRTGKKSYLSQGIGYVAPHSRKMKIRKRPYLGPALRDQRKPIVQRGRKLLREHVQAAVAASKGGAA